MLEETVPHYFISPKSGLPERVLLVFWDKDHPKMIRGPFEDLYACLQWAKRRPKIWQQMEAADGN